MSWFESTARWNFERFLLEAKPEACVQIGVFEGDASVWMLENLSCVLYDIDPFGGSEDLTGTDWSAVKARYRRRIKEYPGRVFWWPDKHLTKGGTADFVYIDGDHRAPTVLSDACWAFDHVVSGGLIAFDDYTWQSPLGRLHQPQAAIDSFLDLFSESIEVVEKGLQVWVRKN